MPAVVKEAMKFLGKNYSDDEIEKLCDHLSVNSMRANPSCNNDSLVEMAKNVNGNGKSSGDFKFIRRGQVGSFKEEFSEEMNQQFEDFVNQPNLIESGFKYKF